MNMDIVMVCHTDEYFDLSNTVERDVQSFSTGHIRFFKHDNRIENIGFAKACNLTARLGDATTIGFLNPDVEVTGDIFMPVWDTLKHAQVTGERFGKEPRILKAWGLSDWVCGAAMFVQRSWWNYLNGFDESYVWSHEETDFCYRTQKLLGKIKSISLPITHLGGTSDDYDEIEYKNHWHENGRQVYNSKWGEKA